MQFSKALIVLFAASLATAAPLASSSSDLSSTELDLAAADTTLTPLSGAPLMRRAGSILAARSSGSLRDAPILRTLSDNTLYEMLDEARGRDVAAIAAKPSMGASVDRAIGKLLGRGAPERPLSEEEAQAFGSALDDLHQYVNSAPADFPALVGFFQALDEGWSALDGLRQHVNSAPADFPALVGFFQALDEGSV